MIKVRPQNISESQFFITFQDLLFKINSIRCSDWKKLKTVIVMFVFTNTKEFS